MSGAATEAARGAEALELIRAFLLDNGLHCAESIYQTDGPIENAMPFIEALANVAGYPPRDDEEDE